LDKNDREEAAGKKRLFIAIDLPEPIRDKLQQLQQELKRYARDAKWVKVGGIHLTLKFLGYVDQSRIPDIVNALSGVVKSFAPVEIDLNGCGFFPNARRPNVLWVGIESKTIQNLQKEVESSMERLSFEKEDRAFAPHLTLARFRDPKGLLPLTQAAEKLSNKISGNFVADHISLFQSILRREGAEYIVLKKFSLETTL
jgi:RNA 2',3'-cyclic 3'-phosphodiesterase